MCIPLPAGERNRDWGGEGNFWEAGSAITGDTEVDLGRENDVPLCLSLTKES